MIKIVFATHNKNKLEEIQKMTEDLPIEIISLDQIDFYEDIEETGSTMNENALIKANYIYNRLQYPVIAEDSGLEVEALGGDPGVYSE